MSTQYPILSLRAWLCMTMMVITPAPLYAESGANARRDYMHIERNLKQYKRLETDLSDCSTEGGTLVAYFQNGAARKLVARYYAESGRATEEYYFSRGQLFFVLSTEMRYGKSLGEALRDKSEAGKVVKTTQNRYYYAAGKLTRWIDENGKTRPVDSEWSTRSRETLGQARDLLTKANSLRN